MSSPPVLPILATGLLIGIGIWALNRALSGGSSSEEEERYGQRRRREAGSYGSIPISNPYNNHDQNKVRHSTQHSAEREVERMKRMRVPGYERLNVYYNEQTEGYYVGRSKW